MSDELKVRKLTHVLPIAVTGTDGQGRVTGICPHCGDEGYFEDEDDGRFVCPLWSGVMAHLTPALAGLLGIGEDV